MIFFIQVCIRSCPLYYPGAIGFTTVNGEPKVGELLDKAWSISEKCQFRIVDKDSSNTNDASKNAESEQEGDSKDTSQDCEKMDEDVISEKNESKNEPPIGKSAYLIFVCPTP